MPNKIADLLIPVLVLGGLAFLTIVYARVRMRGLLTIGKCRLIRTAEFRRLHRRYRNIIRFGAAYALFGVISVLLYTAFMIPLMWACVNAFVCALIFVTLIEGRT